jgi:hypothetical protein
MGLFLDSFWRAALYCLQPRVMLMSALPLLIAVALGAGLCWLVWDPALAQVQAWLGEWQLFAALMRWLEKLSLGSLRTVVAPLLLFTLALPFFFLLSLLAVAWLAAPAAVRLVASRRFPQMQRRRGGSFLGSVAMALGSALVALLALGVTLPLWLVPPLVVVVPPLVWGWLTARVMAYDALAQHASAEERQLLMRRHRWPFLAMGLMVGYLGVAPGLIWAFGAVAVILAPLLIPLAIWLYTFVFLFASLWFAHFGLAALERLRGEPIDISSP